MPAAKQDIYACVQGLAVTKSDTIDIDGAPRALWVGTAGDVTVLQLNNNTPVTYKNVGNGVLLPIQCRRVMATGTTASDIVAMF